MTMHKNLVLLLLLSLPGWADPFSPPEGARLVGSERRPIRAVLGYGLVAAIGNSGEQG